MCKIDSVRLVGCQSWDDTTIELGPGINVLFADNDTGKSVFFKILKAVASPNSIDRDEMKELIRDGYDYAEAYYLFTDGSLGLARIFPNRILYYYTRDAKNGEVTQREGAPHDEFLDKLSVLVEPKSGFTANILDDPGNMLLVNSNPKTNSSLLQILAKDERVDRLIELFKNKVADYQIMENNVTIVKNGLERKLKTLEYVNVEDLESNINLSEKLLDCADTLNRVLITTNSLQSLVKNYQPYTEYKVIAAALDKFNDICDNINYSKSIPDELKSIIGLVESADNFQQEYTSTVDPELGKAMLNIISIYENASNLNIVETLDFTKLKLEVEAIENLDKMLKSSANLYNTLVQSKKVEDTLKELKAIDFGGQSFDCPIYGKIIYEGNKCTPV